MPIPTAFACGERAPSTDLRIGVPGSRYTLENPALIVERSALKGNIARMARLAEKHGVGVRPHVKAHKCLDITLLQIAAGAVGIACATIGEAMAMAHAQVPSILITSPLVTACTIRQLALLATTIPTCDVMVVADNPETVNLLAEAARASGCRIGVLVDLDVGQRRTGVVSLDDMLRLAEQIYAQDSLILRGLQAYAGHIQHIRDRKIRLREAAAVQASISAATSYAFRHGVRFEIITGGGTGTHDCDIASGIFTELQPGSYIFMDAEYADVVVDGVGDTPFEISLFVQSMVVCVNQPDWVVVNAGSKAFARDAGVPKMSGPASEFTGDYAFAGDEHGKVTIRGRRPALGERIEFVTPHCDPTVNLYQKLHVCDGDRLVDVWSIDPRSKY